MMSNFHFFFCNHPVYRRSSYVERAAIVCGTRFNFTGEPENRITLQDFQNITWPNTALLDGLPVFEPTTTITRGHRLIVQTTRHTAPPGRSSKPPTIISRGSRPTTTRSRPRYWPIRTTRITLPPRLSKNTKSSTVTPTFRTETDWQDTYFGPTAETTVVHHYHYHKSK